MTDRDDEMLDGIFDTARRVSPAPNDALMARVLADAARLTAAPPPVPSVGFWGQISANLGGWPVLGGLATVTAAGLWIGVAPPASVENIAARMMGDTVTVTLLSTDAAFDLGEW